MENAYESEEDSFKRTVDFNSLDSVPDFASVISSQVIYNIMVDDDISLKLKAKNAPHTSEHSMQH